MNVNDVLAYNRILPVKYASDGGKCCLCWLKNYLIEQLYQSANKMAEIA
jgi:hypothetical protein